MVDDIATELLIFEEDLGCLIASEVSLRRELNSLLEDLHTAFGSGFVWTLKEITMHSEFKPLSGEVNIYTTGGETGDDYDNLLNAARKAVEHGYRVFILPNPKTIRTADFIFERKGVYKLFDLKTISGKASVGTRLEESKGQTNRVLLNISTDYDPVALARSVKRYFERNSEALEVLIFKRRKSMSVTREDAESKYYFKQFVSKYTK